jgi:hypothetical protein
MRVLLAFLRFSSDGVDVLRYFVCWVISWLSFVIGFRPRAGERADGRVRHIYLPYCTNIRIEKT